MILYHGTNAPFATIDLQKSNPAKDFGRAFYLSDEESQAEEMATFKVNTFGGSRIIQRYQFDEAVLQSPTICYKQFESYTEEWARFILANRNDPTFQHDYDIIYGPIANDRIGRQIFNFEAGYIDFDTFIQRIKFPKGITFQYAFCTPRAIAGLTKL